MSDTPAAFGGASSSEALGRRVAQQLAEADPASAPQPDPNAHRLDSLAAWVQQLETKVGAIAAAGNAPALEELQSALEVWSKHDPKLEERVTNRVDVLADRVDTLAKTVATTSATIAAREGEIATLRRQLDEANTKAHAAIAELRRQFDPTAVTALQGTVAKLSEDAAALQEFSDKATTLKQGYQRLLDEFRDGVDALNGRLDSLAGTNATTTARFAAHERDLAELRARLDAGSARVDEVVSGVRQAIDSLSAIASAEERASAGSVAALEDRVDMLVATVGALTARLDGLAERSKNGALLDEDTSPS
jgi:chromosome segregation ATPase